MKLKKELLSYLLYLNVLLLFRGEGKQYHIRLKLNAYYGISGKPFDAVYRSFIKLPFQLLNYRVVLYIRSGSDQWLADVLIVSNTMKKRCLPPKLGVFHWPWKVLVRNYIFTTSSSGT